MYIFILFFVTLNSTDEQSDLEMSSLLLLCLLYTVKKEKKPAVTHTHNTEINYLYTRLLSYVREMRMNNNYDCNQYN